MVHVPCVPSESFVFRKGTRPIEPLHGSCSRLNADVQLKLQLQFPGTIQYGFYHREVALESRSGKIATVILSSDLIFRLQFRGVQRYRTTSPSVLEEAGSGRGSQRLYTGRRRYTPLNLLDTVHAIPKGNQRRGSSPP